MKYYIRPIGSGEYSGPLSREEIANRRLNSDGWEVLVAKGQTHGQVVRCQDWVNLSTVVSDEDLADAGEPVPTVLQSMRDRSRYKAMRRWVDVFACVAMGLLILPIVSILLQLPAQRGWKPEWELWKSLFFTRLQLLALGGFLVIAIRSALVLFIDRTDLEWDEREESRSNDKGQG